MVGPRDIWAADVCLSSALLLSLLVPLSHMGSYSLSVPPAGFRASLPLSASFCFLLSNPPSRPVPATLPSPSLALVPANQKPFTYSPLSPPHAPGPPGRWLFLSLYFSLPFSVSISLSFSPPPSLFLLPLLLPSPPLPLSSSPRTNTRALSGQWAWA